MAADARKALKTLPPEKRLAQTCNIEALGQIGNAGKLATTRRAGRQRLRQARPSAGATAHSVSNGAFRVGRQKWVGRRL